MDDKPDADPTELLEPGHPLIARGPLRATWRRWVLDDGRVRWTWRVEWQGPDEAVLQSEAR